MNPPKRLFVTQMCNRKKAYAMLDISEFQGFWPAFS